MSERQVLSRHLHHQTRRDQFLDQREQLRLVQAAEPAYELEAEALAHDGRQIEQLASLVGQTFGATLDGGEDGRRDTQLPRRGGPRPRSSRADQLAIGNQRPHQLFNEKRVALSERANKLQEIAARRAVES